MNKIQRVLTKQAIKKFSQETSFNQAKRDKNGNLILKRPTIIQIMPFIFFLICSAYLILEIVPNINNIDYLNNNLPFLTFVGVMGLFLAIISIPFMISKILISYDGITKYGFPHKKYITFDSITSVEYTSKFGGSAVINTNITKLIIPFELCGFYEFFEILRAKLGQEECMAIETKIQERKKVLNNS